MSTIEAAPGMRFTIPPRPNWKVDMFGDGVVTVILYFPHVSWWRRITTWFFFGSRWRRI